MALSVDLGRSLQTFQSAGRGKRLKKDFEQLSRWFEIALNNMGRGLSLFDAKQHLIVCNKRYHEIFSLPESLTRPGTPFAEIIRFHVKMETGRDGPEELAAQRKWIDSQVAEMALGKSFSSTRQLKDGRTILVSNHPLPDGGWVDLQEDITEKCEAKHTRGRFELQTSIIDRLAIISETDPRGIITYANDNFCCISGYTPDELIGKTHAIVNSGLHPKSFWRGMYAAMAKGEVWQAEVRNRAKDGSYYWMKCANAAMHDADGKLRGYLSLRLDITESKALEARLAERSLQLDMVLKHMPAGISMFNSEQRLIVCNDRYRELYELPAHLARPGTPLVDLMRQEARAGTEASSPQTAEQQNNEIAEYLAQLAKGQAFSYTHVLKDGRCVRVGAGPMPDGGWVDAHEDITQQCEAEHKITWLARHDTLTELANRFHFREHLQETFRQLKADETFALHWIDLDRFKEVNDTLGHPVGDALLKSVAKRLRSVLRQPDIVARLGGDEFAIIQRGITTPAQAAHLASRIVRTIAQPHYILGHAVSIGASIGIALAPRDGANADDIVKNADLALYQAKASGRGTYCVFHTAQDHDHGQRRNLETDLRSALSKGELELYYQPIFDVKTREMTGLEALMRWNHPTIGMIAPADFIPLAEETGLIVEMGAWALNEACREAMRWSKPVKVMVNLSPLQFERGDLYSVIAEALAHSGLPAQRLELEITESLLLRDDFATNQMLHKLRALGVSIALDDFGTAYASLSYLRSFPFDKIKIDQTFMRDLDHPERNESVAIIRAVTGLARQLQMTTVAEGVETLEHVNTAFVAGCDEVQGYYFSKPVPADQVDALLAQGKSPTADAECLPAA